MSHKEMAYIIYNMLWNLHILRKSCNNVSKGFFWFHQSNVTFNVYFHTTDRSDTNRMYQQTQW